MRVALKLFTAFWLLVVMPLAGIFPLLNMAGILSDDNSSGLIGLALLRDLRGVFLADPAADVSHLSLYDLAPQPVWLRLACVVFATAVLLVRQHFRVTSRQTRFD
jgi:hypothetical protein